MIRNSANLVAGLALFFCNVVTYVRISVAAYSSLADVQRGVYWSFRRKLFCLKHKFGSNVVRTCGNAQVNKACTRY